MRKETLIPNKNNFPLQNPIKFFLTFILDHLFTWFLKVLCVSAELVSLRQGWARFFLKNMLFEEHGMFSGAHFLCLQAFKNTVAGL